MCCQIEGPRGPNRDKGPAVGVPCFVGTRALCLIDTQSLSHPVLCLWMLSNQSKWLFVQDNPPKIPPVYRGGSQGGKQGSGESRSVANCSPVTRRLPCLSQVQDVVKCQIGVCKSDENENSPDSCKNGQVQIMVSECGARAKAWGWHLGLARCARGGCSQGGREG